MVDLVNNFKICNAKSGKEEATNLRKEQSKYSKQTQSTNISDSSYYNNNNIENKEKYNEFSIKFKCPLTPRIKKKIIRGSFFFNIHSNFRLYQVNRSTNVSNKYSCLNLSVDDIIIEDEYAKIKSFGNKRTKPIASKINNEINFNNSYRKTSDKDLLNKSSITINAVCSTNILRLNNKRFIVKSEKGIGKARFLTLGNTSEYEDKKYIIDNEETLSIFESDLDDYTDDSNKTNGEVHYNIIKENIIQTENKGNLNKSLLDNIDNNFDNNKEDFIEDNYISDDEEFSRDLNDNLQPSIFSYLRNNFIYTLNNHQVLNQNQSTENSFVFTENGNESETLNKTISTEDNSCQL